MAEQRSPLPSTLAAAGVGAGLVLLWWAVFSIAPGLLTGLVGAEDVACAPGADFGCALGAALLSVVLGVAVVVAASIVLGWLVLRLFGVRPAWLVALLGPVLGWALAWLGSAPLSAAFGDSVWRVFVPITLAYGIAGSLTARKRA